MNLIKLSDLFEVKYGVNLELINLEETKERSQGVFFVSRTESNNGVSSFVKRVESILPIPKNTLTVAAGGSVLSTFLQPFEYYSGRDLYYLKPRRKMSERELLFYAICIKRNKYRYNYGRQANRTLASILVPAKVPERFLKMKVQEPDRKPLLLQKLSLDSRAWEWFEYHELFEIKKGKRLVKEEMKEGKTPFVGSSEYKNGITAFIDKPPIHSKNTISVTYNGSVAEAFYQTRDYWASDDVNVLYPKFKLNFHIAMFLVALIRKEKYRFNYGRKWHLERMKEAEIKLPVDGIGKPDWQFMENFIKSLPYSKYN